MTTIFESFYPKYIQGYLKQKAVKTKKQYSKIVVLEY